MQISSIQNLTAFKGATLNINALSDTHGHIELTDNAYQAMDTLKEDVFEKEKDGRKNYLIIGGDWAISGDINGFLTKPDKPLIWFQIEMLNKFIEKIKEHSPKTEVLFTPGNHDLDGGIGLFQDVMKNFDGKILMTNLNFQKSPAFSNLIKNNKLVSSKVDFVKDDKDENKLHPVLNLGVAPVNLDYYVNSEGIELIDNEKIAQKYVSTFHYRKTLDAVSKEVEDFKNKYENGTVILTCHTGANFADCCAKQGGIDLIFDAHEHKDEVRVVNNTPIVALSQNFEKLVNAKINIDDSGSKKEIKITDIKPPKKVRQGELGKLYSKLFEEDSKNIFTIKSEDIKKLDIKNIRNRNNNLANFVCDAVLDGIKEKDPTVQIFALNASAIRGGLKLGDEPQNSMFDVLNCLNGISRGQADIYVNEVTGRELVEIIKDNFEFNAQNPETNPLIHYSGITVDKTNFMKEASTKPEDYCKYITLEDTDETVNPDKTYKIANPEKYFVKSNNPKIKSMQNFAYPLNLNVRDLFCDYFKKHNEITVKSRTRFY